MGLMPTLSSFVSFRVFRGHPGQLGVIRVGRLKNNPFILQFWIVSEVNQQPKLQLRCMEIIQELSPVLK